MTTPNGPGFGDSAAADPLPEATTLVRGAAVWALSQLIAPEKFEALASRATASETDAVVRAEWMDCATQA